MNGPSRRRRRARRGRHKGRRHRRRPRWQFSVTRMMVRPSLPPSLRPSDANAAMTPPKNAHSAAFPLGILDASGDEILGRGLENSSRRKRQWRQKPFSRRRCEMRHTHTQRSSLSIYEPQNDSRCCLTVRHAQRIRGCADRYAHYCTFQRLNLANIMMSFPLGVLGTVAKESASSDGV